MHCWQSFPGLGHAELGGRIAMGPMDIAPGRFAVVLDPEGAAFVIIALNPME